MSRFSIRISKAASVTLRTQRETDALREAAVEAFRAAGSGDIFFAPFSANGRQYALSSRTVLDVEWVPNRVPGKVLREPATQVTRKQRNLR